MLASALAAVALLAAAGIGVAFAVGQGRARPRISGDLVNRRVPRLSLQDAAARTTSLAAFRGEVVVFAPFLTLCHEVCPLTTGAFEAMERSVAEAGLDHKVAFAEVSVDPWRDRPARLRAFARMTGVRLHLLTGTPRELSRFWRFFGVAFYRTKEGSPPDSDWLTHKPLTFDVSHTDGLFLVDARGHERILDVGMPSTGTRISKVLLGLLNAQGRQELAHPQPGWTIEQGLDDIGYLLGRAIPDSGA